ncbi:MAG: transposase [Alcanivorax sp.]|nr:transposase [Alcanivorax sp.]
MTRKTRNKYNHYTENFRRKAVRRADDPNASAAEVAKELSIHSGQIYSWRRQHKRLSDKQFNSVQGVDYSMKESEEIRKLKRQVADLKEENEFLKKATVRVRPRTSAKTSSEVRLHRIAPRAACHPEDVPLGKRRPVRLLQVEIPVTDFFGATSPLPDLTRNGCLI